MLHKDPCFARFIFVDIDADQLASFGVHCGVFEVFGIHFAQSLKSAHVDFSLTAQTFGHPFVALDFIEAIDPLGPLGQSVEGRAGQIEMPCVNHRAHLRKEKRHQQRGDMRAIHIRIGHDDDFIVAQIFCIEFRS